MPLTGGQLPEQTIRYLDGRSRLIKSIIALVLAGGYAEEFHSEAGPIFKALLPVNGRPVVDYVIQALEGSTAEKIFIAQEEGARLQDRLVTTDKCIFFPKKNRLGSFGLSMLSALENVAEYYGNTGLSQKMILVVPCDTPLVTPARCDDYDHCRRAPGRTLSGKAFPQRLSC